MIQPYPSTSSFLCPVSTELSLSMYQYPSPGLSQEGLLGFGRWLWRHSVGFFLHISYSLNKVHMAPKRELVDLQQEKRHFDWSLSAPWPYLTPRVFLFCTSSRKSSLFWPWWPATSGSRVRWGESKCIMLLLFSAAFPLPTSYLDADRSCWWREWVQVYALCFARDEYKYDWSSCWECSFQLSFYC